MTAFVSLLVMAALALPGPSAAVDATLPNGTAISVTIDSPADGDVFVVPAGGNVDVPVTGSASVGVAEPDATFVYVIDVSFSTRQASGGDCGGWDFKENQKV